MRVTLTNANHKEAAKNGVKNGHLTHKLRLASSAADPLWIIKIQRFCSRWSDWCWRRLEIDRTTPYMWGTHYFSCEDWKSYSFFWPVALVSPLAASKKRILKRRNGMCWTVGRGAGVRQWLPKRSSSVDEFKEKNSTSFSTSNTMHMLQWEHDVSHFNETSQFALVSYTLVIRTRIARSECVTYPSSCLAKFYFTATPSTAKREGLATGLAIPPKKWSESH